MRRNAASSRCSLMKRCSDGPACNFQSTKRRTARTRGLQRPEIDLPGSLLAAKSSEAVRNRAQLGGERRNAIGRRVDHQVNIRAKARSSLTRKVAHESADDGDPIERGEPILEHL